MFCNQCGKENQPDANVCAHCGTPIQAAVPQAPGTVPVQGDVPEEIKGFNFGAFSLNWIWAFAHRLPGLGAAILILSFIPCVGFINIGFAIYLGFKGNELAWKSRPFQSVQQFKDTQRVWAIWGLIVFAAAIVFGIIFFAFIIAILTEGDTLLPFIYPAF